MYWVYAIKSLKGDRVYIGQTANLLERVQTHNRGLVESTKADRPWRLIAFEECDSREAARWLEKCLKNSRGRRIRWLARA